MSDIDEVVEAVESLERKFDRMERTWVEVTGDLVRAIQVQGEMIERFGEVMALAKSPSEKDLERFASLREAYDKYAFKRTLILGKEEE